MRYLLYFRNIFLTKSVQSYHRSFVISANGLVENGLVNGFADQDMQQTQHHGMYQTGVIQNSNLVASGICFCIFFIGESNQRGLWEIDYGCCWSGSIPSTGQQQRVPPCMPAINIPTSAIGGGISPAVFSQVSLVFTI